MIVLLFVGDGVGDGVGDRLFVAVSDEVCEGVGLRVVGVTVTDGVKLCVDVEENVRDGVADGVQVLVRVRV